MLESVGKRFGTALSPGGNPEQGYQLSRCDNVSTGHSTSAMNSCKCLCCCKEIKELGGSGAAVQRLSSQLRGMETSGVILGSGSTWVVDADVQMGLFISRWPCWTLEQHEGLMRSSQMSTSRWGFALCPRVLHWGVLKYLQNSAYLIAVSLCAWTHSVYGEEQGRRQERSLFLFHPYHSFLLVCCKLLAIWVQMFKLHDKCGELCCCLLGDSGSRAYQSAWNSVLVLFVCFFLSEGTQELLVLSTISSCDF